MCGIFCSDDLSMFEILQTANKKRGDFSTGIFYAYNNANYKIKKYEGGIDWDKEKLPNGDGFLYLGHNQAPTETGRTWNEWLAHPFQFGDWIVAHNGVITNYEKLIDEHLPMHTDPVDTEGPNLFKVVEKFGVQNNIFFSTERLEFEKINIIHNIADFCVNIACNEGFGLATLESMQTGNPIIALKTGGLTRQVVDHRDGSENGFALEPDVRNLVGSQMVPFIYEDHVNNHNVANAFMRMYELGPEGREELGEKARSYVMSEFNISDTVRLWDETLTSTMETWNSNRFYNFERLKCIYFQLLYQLIMMKK